jgi:hypothetical protein
MARNHARIFTSIWHDPDFRALTVDAQHAYLAALSNPDLSYAGVLDYIPQRLAGMAAGHTARRANAALTQLEQHNFMVIDRNTAEMCVRSLVRHDGVLERINMGKATARAYGKVMSLPIRDALIDELARAFSDDPNLAGWPGFQEIDPDAMDRITETASRMASAKG